MSHSKQRSPRLGASASQWHPDEVEVSPFPLEVDSFCCEERILKVLRDRPESTLLGIVTTLWPEFADLPAERRAAIWFWAKEYLRTLEKNCVVAARVCEDGMTLWSVPFMRSLRLLRDPDAP